MKAVSLREIADACGGKLLFGDPECIIRNITTDSRTVPEDALFVPIVGETADGHRFIGKAFENGAKAVFSEPDKAALPWIQEHPEENRGVIVVPDTLSALQKLGAYLRSLLPVRAVGVTGSVGKTTTREMIASALSSGKRVFRTGKNYNNKLGVPITLSELSEEDEIAVLELGLNVPGELGLISSLTGLSCAVITNIGVAHMEYYGSRDRLTEEKLTVVRGFENSREERKVLFLNGDDPMLFKYREATGYPYILYGTGENAEYRAVNIREENGCYGFDFVLRGEKMFPVKLGVPGVHNVHNALAALAVSDYFGLDLQKAAESLSAFTGFQGRLQRIEKDGVVYIDDTYNASPDSMKAGLAVLSEMKAKGGGRKIAVLGDMLELGEKSADYHYEVGSYAAGKKPDMVFLSGASAKEIFRGLLDADKDACVRHFDTAEELKAALLQTIRAGDLVYFKASHGMHFSELLQEILQK